MSCNDFLHQILEDINETFVSQNPELFDIVFEIDGKKLYADKLRLSVASPTFKIMLSNQWHSNKDEPIKITEYKFEDFKNFIAFIYSGECNIHCDNASVMTDIAEFYQIPYLKQLCDEYFSRPYYFADCYEIVLKRIEISSKYALVQTKAAVKKFVNENIYDFIKSDEFLNGSKSNILEFVDLLTNPEFAFAAGYQWSAYQAFKKQEISNDENFNINDAIKAEITEFLPYFDLKKMKKSFLAQHVADNDFIFTDDKAVEFLHNLINPVTVKITNSHGHSISCALSWKTNFPELEIIQSLSNQPSKNTCSGYIYWSKKFKIPSTPCLTKRHGVQWYLIYFCDGDIGAKHYSGIKDDRDYLIAEMVIENVEMGFDATAGCKIEIIE